MTVLDAAQSGDEIEALEATRDKLAELLDDAVGGTAAGLANQLQAVLRRLSELRPSGKVTIDDALAQRRAARAGGAEPSASAGGKRKRAS
jgi:hypothetical protein